MGACVLNGIAAGPAEVGELHKTDSCFVTNVSDKTIQPNVIADVMFLHERGTYQTLYFAFYFGSLTVCSEHKPRQYNDFDADGPPRLDQSLLGLWLSTQALVIRVGATTGGQY